ncbi:MAG: hypothetical protein JSW73_02365 [Candidatus Woesearchaeota archaeon]|nr:MAG: hypothetical protein JSW73_02365 [Candidatus Woesearchaeota archaeon]
MKYLTKLSNLQDYSIGEAHQYFEMILYTSVCFFIPMFIGHPQIAVGIAVNAAIIVAALNLKGYKILPVIIAPSLGALSRGVLFGPFTVYLVYMIPFIWIGNSILLFSFKLFKLKLKKNYLTTLVLGAGMKSGFLFLSAYILYSLSIIPAIFLTAMGIMQLATALGGGIPAYLAQKAKKNLY